MTKSRQNWKARHDDLKAENDRLRAFSDEKVRENEQLTSANGELGCTLLDAFEERNQLRRQLLDKTSNEEVLRKAIEEAQTKYENTIRTIHIIVGEGFGFQDETTLTWWAKLHQFTEKALSEKPRKEGE